MEIGTKLQRARIDKALGLREIANVTKISPSVLELIERNDFSRLPGGIFTRGYLRSYATQLGLDPEEVVNEYRARFESSREEVPIKVRSSYGDASMSAVPTALLLVLGLALMTYLAVASRSADPVPDLKTAEVEVAPAVAEVEVVQNVPGAVASPAKAAEWQGLRIELQPHALCWISATADGQLVVYRLMQPGERATIEARNEVLLRVGDAAALTFLINGAPGRRLGRPGEVVTVRLTSGDFDTWLAPSPSPRGDDLDAGAPERGPGPPTQARR